MLTHKKKEKRKEMNISKETPYQSIDMWGDNDEILPLEFLLWLVSPTRWSNKNELEKRFSSLKNPTAERLLEFDRRRVVEGIKGPIETILPLILSWEDTTRLMEQLKMGEYPNLTTAFSFVREKAVLTSDSGEFPVTFLP